MTGRQLIKAIYDACDGDDRLLDAELQVTAIVDADTGTSGESEVDARIESLVYDGPQMVRLTVSTSA